MAGGDASEIRGVAQVITQPGGDGQMSLQEDERELYLKLGRRELQRLCKVHGIKANLPNHVMANELIKLRKGQATPRRFLRKNEKGFRGLDGEGAIPPQALTFETTSDPGTTSYVQVIAESTAVGGTSEADASETGHGKHGRLDEPKHVDELHEVMTTLSPKAVSCDFLGTPEDGPGKLDGNSTPKSGPSIHEVCSTKSGSLVDQSHIDCIEGPAGVKEDKKSLDRQQAEEKSPDNESQLVQQDASKGLASEKFKGSESVQPTGEATSEGPRDAADIAFESQELTGLSNDAQSKAAAAEVEGRLTGQKEQQIVASFTTQDLPHGDACKTKALAEDYNAPTACGDVLTAALLRTTPANPMDVCGTLGTELTSGRTAIQEPLTTPDAGVDASKGEVTVCTEENRSGQYADERALDRENIMPVMQPMLTSLSVVRILQAEEKRKATNERLGKFLQQRKPLKVSVFRNMEMTMSRAGIRAKEQKIARDTIIMTKRMGLPL